MKNTNEFSLCNAMKNNMSRSWQKTLAVLVAMVVFTISPVITVMAAARQVNITVDGETSSSMITCLLYTSSRGKHAAAGGGPERVGSTLRTECRETGCFFQKPLCQ